jgi:acetyl esterase/lipase
VDVGELDIYRDESISFARGLLAAGISCELHVHPGTPHAPEEVAPQADVCRRMLADRVRVLTSL